MSLPAGRKSNQPAPSPAMYPKAYLSLVFAAYSIVSVHARVCNDKHVIESKPLTMPSGHVITVQTFNCSNTIPSKEEPSSTVDRRHSLDLNTRRDASQCTTTNCICGVPCFFDHCTPVTPPQTIRAIDCQNLASSLISTPGTLTIPPGQAIAFILESCEYAAFGTSATQPTQYCFGDMGVAASEVFHVCGANSIGSCGGNLGAAKFFVDQL